MVFPRTHSLIVLLELCLSLNTSFEFLRDALILLERYAVQYRYPGETADKSDARLAFQASRAVRAFMRDKFGVI